MNSFDVFFIKGFTVVKLKTLGVGNYKYNINQTL